jgi:hypothetical protein
MAVGTTQVGQLGGVEEVREATRRYIAYLAIGAYFVIIFAILAAWLFSPNAKPDDALKVLTTTAGVLGGIVGAVIGFYFQTEK